MAANTTDSVAVTHVSVIAEDVEESTRFYTDVLGCNPIETPSLGRQHDFDADEDISLQILEIGDQQLHLWNDPAHETEATRFAHFGIHVDDFEQVYHAAKEREIFAMIGVESASPKLFEFNGMVQMYIRDPTGNLIEVDYPDIDQLDESVLENVVSRETAGVDTTAYTPRLRNRIS